MRRFRRTHKHVGYGHEEWHQGFYNALQRPDGKGSCCNLTDCRPDWISVPQTKIIGQSALEGAIKNSTASSWRLMTSGENHTLSPAVMPVLSGVLC